MPVDGRRQNMLKRLLIALLALLMLAWPALAETVELSNWYGQPIADAAEAIGGMAYTAGEEFTDNYDGDAVALRGNDGVVKVIELKAGGAGYSLCGVAAGMNHKEVKDLMNGCPILWEYDEEVAFLVKTDPTNELNDVMLVVFFDENFKVNGAWYRDSE